MTCDGRCSSHRKQPVFSIFSRTVQSSGVAWTWAASKTKSGRLFHTRAAATGKARLPPSNGSEVKDRRQLRQKGESSDGKTSKTRLKIAKQNVPSHCPRRDALANVRLGRTDDWKSTEKHKIACIIRYYYCYYYYIPSLASGNLEL